MKVQTGLIFIFVIFIGFGKCLENEEIKDNEPDLQTGDLLEDVDIQAINKLLESENIENVSNTNDGNVDYLQPTDISKITNYEEADDMEYGGYFENRTIFTYEDPIPKEVDEPEKEPEAEGIKLADPIQSNLKYNVEWIESADENTIDIDEVHREPINVIKTVPWITTMAFIGAAFLVFLLGGVIFYMSLAKRYNNRLRLINEEDMIDPNDMKHFSL